MKKWILPLSIFLFLMPLAPKAQTELADRKEVFSFLEEAFQAQVALSDKERTMEEVNKVLQPFFSKKYSELFLKENLVAENGKYRTYGSDFAQYFIPFFRFSEKTKVVIEPKQIYVFEYFPESKEGPVGYKAHYEGLLLEKISGQWKVNKYLYNDIPANIIKQAGFAPKKAAAFKKSSKGKESISIHLKVGLNPIQNFVQYGALMGLAKKETITAMLQPKNLGLKIALK